VLVLIVIYSVFCVLDNILDNFDTFFTKGATLTIESLQK